MNVRHRSAFAEGRGGFLFVCAATLLFAAAYLWLDLNKLHALRFGSDTGIYLQAVLNFLHTGSTFDYGDWHPEMALHDQWLMFVLAPFVGLWPSPTTVIVVQVIAVALGAPLLYALARRFGAGDPPSAAFACAYLISPSVQGFAYGDFTPLVFVPILAFALAIAAREKHLLWTLVCVQLLTGAKEDVALFVAWFGLVAALFYDRRIGIAVTLLALVNLGAYQYAEHLAGVLPVRPQYALRDSDILRQLAFFAEILAPFAFAPLRLGWRVLLAAPLAAELMLAQNWPFPLYQGGGYYTIPIVTLVAAGAAYVVAQKPRIAWYMPATAAIMALAFNVTVLHIGRHPFSPDPQYSIAEAWSRTAQPVDFACEDQSAWVVASPDLHAKLDCPASGPLSHTRPAWKNVPLNSSAPWTRGPSAQKAARANGH
jgi:uncharacterized membrane protein